MENESDRTPNTRERMADRPPLEPTDPNAASSTAVDDTESLGGGSMPIDDV